MSSELYRAIQLAQEGQNDTARTLLLQIVKEDPNNEVAWQWLASVAANTSEYRHALSQVLRINPDNEQAKAAAEQLQDLVPPAVSPPAQSYGTPPVQSYGTPPVQSYGAPPPAPYAGQPYPAPYAAPQRRKGGCASGCVRLLLLLVVMPVCLCGVISFLGGTLGPLDNLAVFFPGAAGRKTIEFEADDYTVSVTVPRSWYAAVEGETWWEFWADFLNSAIPLSDEGEYDRWQDLAVDSGDIRSSYGGDFVILDTNPLTLASGGSFILLHFEGIFAVEMMEDFRSFDCEPLRVEVDRMRQDTGDNFISTELIQLDDNLCGVRLDSAVYPDEAGLDPAFQDYLLPDKMRYIAVFVPDDENQGSAWTILLPEEWYEFYQGDIDAMVESVKITS